MRAKLTTETAERRVTALRFKQWLDIWNGYDFNKSEHRRKPDEHVYVFSMPAGELRQLCDVYRRKRDGSNVEGIQRVRDESRTSRIRRYVRYGYPYGDLKPPQRTEQFAHLRKPGWLPTAIVVNILTSDDQRRGRAVNPDHLISIGQNTEGAFELVIPPIASIGQTELAPLEVIDGQHRLWAFDEGTDEDPLPDDFELPVVAFYGLDIAWQAYLFWSINVSPKKINPSHAFDLYPLLRTQEWLESAGELPVYREARAQELTEAMFTHSRSVWKGRINMLGETGPGRSGSVSQAAWVRSLLTTFLATGRGTSRPGLFQANLTRDDEPLEWARSQQAAFLIRLWADIRDEIRAGVKHLWIRQYNSIDEAFTGRHSMLNQDQGLRAVSAVANDIFFERAEEWKLDRWFPPPETIFGLDHDQINNALKELESEPFREHIRRLATALLRFDWRSLDGPGVQEGSEEAVRKRSYRGSGGYTGLWHDVLERVAEDERSSVGRAARHLLLDSHQ